MTENLTEQFFPGPQTLSTLLALPAPSKCIHYWKVDDKGHATCLHCPATAQFLNYVDTEGPYFMPREAMPYYEEWKERLSAAKMMSPLRRSKL